MDGERMIYEPKQPCAGSSEHMCDAVVVRWVASSILGQHGIFFQLSLMAVEPTSKNQA